MSIYDDVRAWLDAGAPAGKLNITDRTTAGKDADARGRRGRTDRESLLLLAKLVAAGGDGTQVEPLPAYRRSVATANLVHNLCELTTVLLFTEEQRVALDRWIGPAVRLFDRWTASCDRELAAYAEELSGDGGIHGAIAPLVQRVFDDAGLHHDDGPDYFVDAYVDALKQIEGTAGAYQAGVDEATDPEAETELVWPARLEDELATEVELLVDAVPESEYEWYVTYGGGRTLVRHAKRLVVLQGGDAVAIKTFGQGHSQFGGVFAAPYDLFDELADRCDSGSPEIRVAAYDRLETVLALWDPADPGLLGDLDQVDLMVEDLTALGAPTGT